MAPIIETAISLVFIYILFSLVVSWINELLVSLRGVRGKYLRKQLSDAFQDRFNQKNWAEMIYVHPSIDILAKRDARPPSYIPSHLFALSFIDIIINEAKKTTFVQEENSLSFASKEDWINTTADASQIEKFKAGLSTLRDSDTKAMLTTMLDNSQDNFGLLKDNIAKWYEDYMDRITGWYKRSVRWYLFFIGLTIAIGANVNSLHLFTELYRNSKLRTPTLKAADSFLQAHPDGLENTIEDGSQAITFNNFQTRLKQVDSIYAQTKALNLPIGWNSRNVYENTNGSWWYWPLVLIGWLITGFALSFGAPFWFDTLKRFANMRSTGLKPEKDTLTVSS